MADYHAKGAEARNASLTPERRSEIARAAGRARWAKAKAPAMPAPVAVDKTHEVHGIGCADGISVTILERAHLIHLSLHGFSARNIAPEDARYLADKLNRLARRIDERNAR